MPTATQTKPRRETKLDVIERMVSRKRGASETELTQTLGWTPHSLTGGISRVRTRGTLTIRKESDPKRGTVFFGSKDDDTGGHVTA